jgi:hypothetical protein
MISRKNIDFTHFFRFGIPALALALASPFSFSGAKPPRDSDVRADSCQEVAEGYLHGALKYFNSMLCMINVEFPSRAEEVLYKLVNDMGLDPDLSSLAADGTPTNLPGKTLRGKSVTGTVAKVVSPDTFAGTYDNVAAISVDGAQHVKIYWSGSGADSKGFLTMGGQGFRPVGKHLLYVRWDRTDSTSQSVEVLATHIGPNSSYLGNPQALGLARRGDRALFGKINFNEETKAISVEVTTIGARRGAQSSSAQPGCFMMYATGTKDGTMTIAKTHDAKNDTGHATNASTQDGSTDMDSVQITDSETTPNGTGNSGSAPGFAMSYSCADLAGAADSSSDPFYGGAVDFGLTKSEADTLFGAN